MDKDIIKLTGPWQRQYAAEKLAAAEDGAVVTIAPPTRTQDQNAKLWPMLADVSKQVQWHGRRLSADDWKDVFTAALKQELRVVPNIDGTGFVALGQRTSTMGKRLFSDLIELIYAFGAQHGVKWSEPVTRSYGEGRAA